MTQNIQYAISLAAELDTSLSLNFFLRSVIYAVLVIKRSSGATLFVFFVLDT